MKKNPFKLLGIVLLGGLLGLPVFAGSKQIIETRAEDSNSVTFTSFADKGSSSGGGVPISFSQSDVTVSASGGYSTKGVLRLYSGKKLTISSKNYKIGNIDFEMDESDSKKYYDATLAAGIKDVNDYSWSYTASKQLRFKTITVNFAVSDATVSSLSVDSNTTPKSLVTGSVISYDGVKINARLSNEEVYNFAEKCEFSPAEGTILSEVGPQEVTVTYKATNTPTTTSGEDLVTTFTVSVTQGEKPTVYSKATSIAAGDKVIIVNEGASKAAKSVLTTSDTAYKHYLDTTDITISKNKANVLSTDGVGEYTVEKGSINGTFAFKNSSGKYLSLYSVDRDGLKFVDTKDAASSWTVDLTASTNRIKSNVANQAYDSTVYLKYNVNTFRGYKASSLVAEPSIFKYSSDAEKISVQSTASVIEGSTISLNSEATGFAPSSYSWTVGDSEVVSIEGSATNSSVTIKGLKAGSTTVSVKANNNNDLVATCVVTVIAKKDALIENGEYFITDFSGSHVLNVDMEDISTPDYTDSSSMWTIANTGVDGDTYSISNGSKYLFHNPTIKNSSLDLSSDSSKYWVVSKNDDNSFTFAYSETGNTLSCNPAASTGTWFAYAGATGTQDHIKLLKVGEFVEFEVEKMPTTKEYYEGEDFKPLNSKINAVFDNGAKVDVTDQIVWDKMVGGTKATGKITLGGVERIVEVPNLTIYAPVQGGFTITGLQDKYYAGEKFSNSIQSITLTYKFNELTKDRVLTKEIYVVEPDILLADTTSVRVSLKDDPDTYKDYDVTIESNKMLATGGIKAGDIVSFGTLNYDAYDLKGGVELTYDGESFTPTNFGYLPLGNTRFEVGKIGSNYTFKEVNTGFYLRGENKALELYDGLNQHSASKGNDGSYSFNLNVNIAGGTQYVNMFTGANPDVSLEKAFTCYEPLSDDYLKYVSGYSVLSENKLVFEYYDWNVAEYDAIETVEIELAYWRIEGGTFVYSLQGDVTETPDECLFTCSYTVDIDGFECWDVSSVGHPEKTIQYNRQGDKIGMYDYDSYESIMLFRDDSISSGIQSLTVSFASGMNEVQKGDKFPWTSALIVKANYGGGVVKQIPVGGYDVVLPNTSTIGSSKGSVTVDGITKEFTITVKGHTSAFDVVCKDPVLVGEEYQAHLADGYTPPEDEPIQWSTSDSSIATIDKDGWITGLKDGYVDIIATSFDGTYSDSEHIHIYQQVTSVELNVHEIELDAGATSQLSATVKPDGASNKTVTYSSSDPSIAAVDSKTGLITAVSEGEATITCAAQNHPEENFDTCVVTVKPAPIVHVTGITLNATEKEVEEKGTFQLEAIITPSNATVKNVTWSSNHENIATVDQTGKVKGVSKGQCIITATTADGGLTASCTVNVKKTGVDPIDVESVTLSKTDTTMNIGDSFDLVATVLPLNSDIRRVYFESSDTNIVTVSSLTDSTARVTATGSGEATITAKCDGVEAICWVHVNGGQVVVNVESVSLNKAEIELEVESEETLIATVNPTGATEKGVIWSSSNAAIASVDQNGKVSALAEGTTIITVTTVDGSKQATCVVTVTKTVDPIDPVDPEDPISDEEMRQQAIVAVSAVGGVAVVGVGCGVGIPLGIHKKHKKLHK